VNYFWRVYRLDGRIDEIDAHTVEISVSGAAIFKSQHPEVIMAPQTWVRILRVTIQKDSAE